MLARLVYYRLPARARRMLRPSRRRPIVLGERFAIFDREGAPPIALYSDYRSALKGRWRISWPETRVLLALHREDRLPADLRRCAEELLADRTLPFAPAELRPALQRLAEALPERLAGVQLLPSADEIDELVSGYRSTASVLLARVGGTPRRALEIGAGSGYLSFALAAAGVQEVVASDRDPEGYVDAVERESVRAALGASNVPLVPADAERLPFSDREFDLVFSWSALEHVRDAGAALRECHRVLRPGGTACHVVDAWFGPGGGHSLCGLDAPWGHVRLTGSEFARYVELHRPFEAVDATRAWDGHFQQPRLASAELAAAARSAGFRIAALELPRRRDHLALLTPEIEADCRRIHEAATRDDLLAESIVLVLRRTA
jgi:SAM-dependent methyltransferase